MLCLACTCSMGKKSLSRGVPHIVENLALIHCDRDILWEFLPIYILPLLILLICYILSYFQFSCYPGFYILIWWPCKQNWNSSFRFVCQYWSNIWVLHFSLESAVSILLEVRLSSLVLSTYMEEEGASAIMRWGRHLGVKCAERECVWPPSSSRRERVWAWPSPPPPSLPL